MAHVFSTAQVCERFEIHRNTLFRWEEEKRIPCPRRNLRGEREYTEQNLETIAQLLQTSRHARLYAQIAKEHGATEDDRRMLSELGEKHALFKFIHLRDVTGLAELKEYSPLHPSTIRQLLKYALDHTDPHEDQFWEVLDVIRDTSKPVSKQQSVEEETNAKPPSG